MRKFILIKGRSWQGVSHLTGNPYRFDTNTPTEIENKEDIIFFVNEMKDILAEVDKNGKQIPLSNTLYVPLSYSYIDNSEPKNEIIETVEIVQDGSVVINGNTIETEIIKPKDKIVKRITKDKKDKITKIKKVKKDKEVG